MGNASGAVTRPDDKSEVMWVRENKVCERYEGAGKVEALELKEDVDVIAV